jgi:hypothetical protein
MGAFNINITGVGGHGCERKAKAGDKLYGRCGRFSCPDCAAYDFVQRMKQSGMVRETDPQAIGGANNVELAEGEDITPEQLAAGMHVVCDTTTGKRYAQLPMQALFTHWPGTAAAVVDDMLSNTRKSGQF